MDLIDRDELRRVLLREIGTMNRTTVGRIVAHLDAMPSAVQPVSMTRDDVLAALDAAEARGDKAKVQMMPPSSGEWESRPRRWMDGWCNPEVPRFDVRVRVVEQAPEQVPLTQLVGRTIHGETEPVAGQPFHIMGKGWHYQDAERWLHGIPVDLATGLVAVRPVGEA